MEQLRLTFGIDGKQWQEVDRFFLVSAEVLGNLKPMYEKFLPTIRKEIKDNFKAEGRPTKWKALSARYLASPRKINSKFPMAILKLTGKMFKAATGKAKGHIESVTKDGIVYGVNLKDIPYARLHDKGGKIGGRGGGKMMPQREYLRLTKEGVRRITQKAHRFIRSRMGRGKIKFD